MESGPVGQVQPEVQLEDLGPSSAGVDLDLGLLECKAVVYGLKLDRPEFCVCGDVLEPVSVKANPVPKAGAADLTLV